MYKFFKTLFAVALIAPIVVFAQEAAVAVADAIPAIVAPSADEWKALLSSLGGLKGAGALAIVAVVVQVIMLALRSKLGKRAGKWRLAAVMLLSLIGGMVAMRMSGIEWMPALLHANTMAAAQVLLHQLWKQFTEKASA